MEIIAVVVGLFGSVVIAAGEQIIGCIFGDKKRSLLLEDEDQ